RSATFRVIVGEGGAPSVRRQGARLPNARPDETPMWASSPVFGDFAGHRRYARARRWRQDISLLRCLSMSGTHLIETPTKADGAQLWRIARDSAKLDLNSPYAYLLWCRDFAETSCVAREGDEAVGFV